MYEQIYLSIMSSSLHQIHNSPPTPDSTPHISANPGVNPGIQPWGFKEIISYNPQPVSRNGADVTCAEGAICWAEVWCTSDLEPRTR